MVGGGDQMGANSCAGSCVDVDCRKLYDDGMNDIM